MGQDPHSVVGLHLPGPRGLAGSRGPPPGPGPAALLLAQGCHPGLGVKATVKATVWVPVQAHITCLTRDQRPATSDGTGHPPPAPRVTELTGGTQ